MMLMQIPSIQLAVFGMPGGWEMIIVLVIALLIFGRKLPEVGRGLGKGLVEFKKGLKGVKDELDDVDREVDSAVNRKDDEPKQLDATDPDELADETKAGKSKTEA